MNPSVNIIEPLRPSSPQWRQVPVPSLLGRSGYAIEAWFYPPGAIAVLSAVEVAYERDGSTPGPEYHLSMSRQRLGRGTERLPSIDAQWVLEQFGGIGALEDNHVESGLVRNFWRPVAQPLIGRECPCVADEPAIREDKGDFVWHP